MQLTAVSSDLADCARKDVNPKYILGQDCDACDSDIPGIISWKSNLTIKVHV